MTEVSNLYKLVYGTILSNVNQVRESYLFKEKTQ